MNIDRKRLRISRVEVLAATAIVCVLVGLLVPAIKAAREPSSYGTPIPLVAPDEILRAYHENGVSIVVPPNWRRTRFNDERDSTWLGFHGGGRYPSTLWIEQIVDDVDLATFDTHWTYQGESHECRITTRDSQTWDDWRYYQLFRHEALVHHGNARYILGFETHENVHELPAMVNLYLQTVGLPAVQKRFKVE